MKLKTFIPMTLLALSTFGAVQTVHAQTKPKAKKDSMTVNFGGVQNPVRSASAAQTAGGSKASQRGPSVKTQIVQGFLEQHPNAVSLKAPPPGNWGYYDVAESRASQSNYTPDPMWVEPFRIYEMKGEKYDTLAVFSQFKHKNIATDISDSTRGGVWARMVVKKTKDKEYDAIDNTISIGVVTYDENMFPKGINPNSTGVTALSMVLDRSKKTVSYGMDGYVFFSGTNKVKIDSTNKQVMLMNPSDGREFHLDTTYQMGSMREADKTFAKSLRKEFEDNFRNDRPAENWVQYKEDAIQTVLFNANDAFNEGEKFGGEQMPGLKKGEKGVMPYEFTKKGLKNLRKLFD